MSKLVTLYSNGTYQPIAGSSNGDVLTWNSATSEWEPAAGSGSGTVTSITAGTGLSGGTITTSGTISMPNVGTASTYGSASSVPVITTDAQGRVSAVTDTSISLAASAITSGQLSLTRGGTGIDASGISAGQILIGSAAGGSIASQAVSGDATLVATGAMTVTGLQGRSVTSTAPAIGQVLQYNGTDWIPGAIPSGGAGGGGVTYYLNYGDTTGISPTTNLPALPFSNSLLGRSFVVAGTSFTSADLTPINTWVPLCGFVTIPTDPGLTTIPAGLWDFNIWASAPASTAASQTAIQAEVYKYDGATSPTLLATSDPVYLYDLGTTAQYIMNVTMPQTTVTTSDRIYVVLSGRKSANPARTLSFYFGDGTPSHVLTTIPSVSGTGLVHIINGVVQTPASAVNLAGGSSEVTGTLPLANVAGPTGVGFGYTSSTGVWNSATLSGTDKLVGFSGTTPAAVTASTGLTLSGGNLTLETVGSATGPTGSATTVPVVTIDVYGRVTALTSAAIAISASSVSSIPYDIAGSAAGVPTASAACFYFVAVRACSIAATGHRAKCKTAPTNTVTFTLKLNGASIGTVQYTVAGGTTGTVTITSGPVAVVAGDSLTLDAPSDLFTMSDPYFTLFATLA